MRTRVVSWKEAAKMKDSVESEALVRDASFAFGMAHFSSTISHRLSLWCGTANGHRSSVATAC